MITTFEASPGATDAHVGTAKTDTRTIYLASSVDGALTLKTKHPVTEDIILIDQAAFSAPGAFALNLPKGMDIYYSYAGSQAALVSIR